MKKKNTKEWNDTSSYLKRALVSNIGRIQLDNVKPKILAYNLCQCRFSYKDKPKKTIVNFKMIQQTQRLPIPGLPERRMAFLDVRFFKIWFLSFADECRLYSATALSYSRWRRWLTNRKRKTLSCKIWRRWPIMSCACRGAHSSTHRSCLWLNGEQVVEQRALFLGGLPFLSLLSSIARLIFYSNPNKKYYSSFCFLLKIIIIFINFYFIN